MQHSKTRLWIAILSLVLLATTLYAADGKPVRFKTDDGVDISGLLWIGGPDRPTVICLPMYRNVKESYAPVVPALLEAGINVLAIDLRGHGESGAEDMKSRVNERDPELFNSMHKDVEAAIRFLESDLSADPTRIGLLGASIGCSVAVHSTVKNRGQVRAVVLMTPGAKYLGVNTLDHLEDWDGVPTLVLTSEEERARTVQPVLDAASDHPATQVEIFQERGVHGTRMFGKVKGVEERIASFLKTNLVDRIDARVPHFAEGHPMVSTPGFVSRTLRAKRHIDDSTFELMVFAVGPTVSFGAMVKQPFRGHARFWIRTAEGPETRVEIPFRHPRENEEPVEARVSRGDESILLEVEQSAFGSYGWVRLELDMDLYRLTGGFGLALALIPDEGVSVNFPLAAEPGGRAYDVSLTHHAFEEEQ